MAFLSKRLRCVADEIGKADTVADIGTDHGKLALYALRKGICKKVIAVDISENSLQKARVQAENSNLSENIEFICGDGLLPLKEIPDVIVIAGMGGNEIVKILSDRFLPARYILMPHQDAHILRRFMREKGLRVIKDYVVEDGKFYTLIVCEAGENDYTDSEIILGRNFPPNEDYVRRLADRKKKIEIILKSQRINPEKLQEELAAEYKEIEKWYGSMTQ